MLNNENEKDEKGVSHETTIIELREQIENLNKGIAVYRDNTKSSTAEAKEAKATAAQATIEVERLKKVIEEATTSNNDDSELKLAPKDQKRLEKWARENGFVTKDEFEKEKNQLFSQSLASIEAQAVEEFLTTHPEYNKDESWSKIREQFAIYKQPTSIVGYRQLLGRIHNELSNSEEKIAKIKAREEQNNRLSMGGGNQNDNSDKTTIETYQEKYPNLSREEIISRLEEINKLAISRKERNSKK